MPSVWCCCEGGELCSEATEFGIWLRSEGMWCGRRAEDSLFDDLSTYLGKTSARQQEAGSPLRARGRQRQHHEEDEGEPILTASNH